VVDLTIDVKLPPDRKNSGTLTVLDSNGAVIAGPFDVYSKADNARAAKEGNAARDPLRPFGDTPEGEYSVPRLIDTGPQTAYSSRSYGPHAAFVLKPKSGDALTAARNGRTGLLIHSGDLGDGGKLRATHGCLRLSNDDMKSVLEAVANAGQNPQFNRCEVVTSRVLVGVAGSEGAGADEDDPPPGIEQLLNPQPIVIP